MKTLCPMLALAVIASFGGCYVARERMGSATLPEGRPWVRIAPGSAPSLTTNQLLSIATQEIKTNGLRFADYKCTDIVFGGQSADVDPSLSNKWTLRFAQQPESVDQEFFVIIDDRTGKSNLRRW
jgi:hypothetical protein